MPEYDSVVQNWDGQIIRVIASVGEGVQQNIDIPVDFIAEGGDNSLHFVQYLLQCLFDESSHLSVAQGGDVDLDEEPRPHPSVTYHFKPESGDRLTPSKGPEGKRRLRAPKLNASESTFSNSKGSDRSGQSSFAKALYSRDRVCVITGVQSQVCTASHLVPVSRPDIYDTILGLKDDSQLYHVSMGVLLRDDLHRLYDLYGLSFYFKDGKYFAHFFVLPHEMYRPLHGKEIDIQAARPYKPMDRHLVAWHYKQCVMARVRGFSMGF